MKKNEWSNKADHILPEGLFKKLQALPGEIVSKNGGIVRQVLFQVAKVPEMRAKEIIKAEAFDTGRLMGAIRKRRDKRPHLEGVNENYQVYVYTGKKRDDPKGAWYWQFIHFKTKINPDNTPFLTMAFESTKDEMLTVFRKVFKRKLILVEKKLDRIK